MFTTDEIDPVLLPNKALVTFAGKPVVDVNSKKIIVDGLTAGAEDVVSADNFGESGEVFNHSVWRGVFAALWSIDECQKYLLGLGSYIMLRGREAKISNKGRYVAYKIPLPANKTLSQEIQAIVGSTANIKITINFATNQSKVPSIALTPERFKCVARFFLVPEMLKAGRFAATTEAIGFGDLIRGLQKYEMQKMSLITADEKAREEIKKDKNFAVWDNLMQKMAGSSERISSKAAAAGSISTKEIYLEDDAMFPGCIWWAGVHAMMTDAANKVKAPSMPADVRPRLEASAFYGDFKRKMIARNIKTVYTSEYTSFLSVATIAASKFIKVGTSMTIDESSALDRLIKEATAEEKIDMTALQHEEREKLDHLSEIQGTSYDDIKQSISRTSVALFSHEAPKMPLIRKKPSTD